MRFMIASGTIQYLVYQMYCKAFVYNTYLKALSVKGTFFPKLMNINYNATPHDFKACDHDVRLFFEIDKTDKVSL